jgi:prephenate dehydratase
MRRVVIQGIAGAYHEIAARRYFAPEPIVVTPSRTFSGLFKMVSADPELLGIVAVENSLAGSILPNLTLLRDSGVRITGECKLRISLNLMALPGQNIEDISEVLSHPVALMQCTDFFSRNPHIKVTESDDTAISARDISEKRLKGVGVIASSLAARLYGLNVLAAGVETNKRNFTRFLIVSANRSTRNMYMPGTADRGKATLVFTLAHRCGSLAAVLSELSLNDCNLMAIQSNPVIGREWEYLFYIDLVFNEYSGYLRAMESISGMCNELEVLGLYTEGEVYFEESTIADTINTI